MWQPQCISTRPILATLAILVWHFYQVFFDPDVYPMNWAWWDGQMPVEHYREEHELDTESLAEAGRETGTSTAGASSEPGKAKPGAKPPGE